MKKEEIFDMLDEYYENKRQQELYDGRGWRIVERVVFVVFIFLPIMCFIIYEVHFSSPEHNEATDTNLNYISVISNDGREILIPKEEYHLSFSEKYAQRVDMVFLCIALAIATACFMMCTGQHTKQQAKEHVALIIGFCSLLLAVFQFFQTCF